MILPPGKFFCIVHTSSAEAFLAGVSEQECEQLYCPGDRTKTANNTQRSLHNFAVTKNGDIDFYCTYLKLKKLKPFAGTNALTRRSAHGNRLKQSMPLSQAAIKMLSHALSSLSDTPIGHRIGNF